MATYEGSPGIPASTTEEDRPFWDDPFVEPKQQHRFTVQMPVYVPTGGNIDTVQLAERIKAESLNITSDKIDALREKLKSAARRASDEVERRGSLRTALSLIDAGSLVSEDKVGEVVHEVFEFKKHRTTDSGGKRASNTNTERFQDLGITLAVKKAFPDGESSIKSLFPPGVDERSKYQLKLRIPEYIAYSFTPPGFSFAPGNIGSDGGGNEIRIEGLGKYGRSAATLTFVTTLRDDLHFSLNLLWTLSSNSSIPGVKKSSVKLFDEFLVGQRPDSQKVLTIYEHYARTVVVPDPENQLGNGKGRSIIGGDDPFAQNTSAVAGIHKLYDPVIESVNFSEFSYGGSELVKITLGLTYGTNYNQSNFYSYQNTEKRYSDSGDTVYSMNKGEYAKESNKYRRLIYGVDEGTGDNRQPAPGSLRHYLMVTKPNSDSGDKKTLKKLKDEKRIRDQIEDNIIGLPIVGDELRPGADDRGIIREIYRSGNEFKINSIFSNAQAAQTAIQNLAEGQSNTARDPSADPPVTNSTSEEAQRVQEAERQQYRDSLAAQQARDPVGEPPPEVPIDYTPPSDLPDFNSDFDPLAGVENTAGTAFPGAAPEPLDFSTPGTADIVDDTPASLDFSTPGTVDIVIEDDTPSSTTAFEVPGPFPTDAEGNADPNDIYRALAQQAQQYRDEFRQSIDSGEYDPLGLNIPPNPNPLGLPRDED